MGFDLYGQNKNSSTGEYFRNNVWWWRRLADFVINETGVIDEKDADGWHENGGHQVSADEAEQIANQQQIDEIEDKTTMTTRRQQIDNKMITKRQQIDNKTTAT
jgi:CBS domain containing-hemolysin-like protein